MPIARQRMTVKGAVETELQAADMLPRLCGVGAKDAVGIAAALPERQRAHLAVFCYGRVHLRELAIAIAKTCSLPALLSAAPSDACGRAIYEATQAVAEPAKPANPFRRPVTLATAASSGTAQLFARLMDEDTDLEPVTPDHAADVAEDVAHDLAKGELLLA